MDGTPNGKRPATLKKSGALIPGRFFSLEMFLQLPNEVLPTHLSRIFLNPKQAFHGRFLPSSEGGPRRVTLKAEHCAFFSFSYSAKGSGIH